MIQAHSGTRAYGCEDEDTCGFWVRAEVFDRIIGSLYMTKPDWRPKFGDDIQGLELLNNLDRGIVPPDFTDMVFLSPEDEESAHN